MKRSESQMSDRRRKISYAIHQEPLSRRRKHRLPQVVGLAFFLVLATVITVGLVFGIGPSNEFGRNTTSFPSPLNVANFVTKPTERTERRENEYRNLKPEPTFQTMNLNCRKSKTDLHEKKSENDDDESCAGKEGMYRFGTVISDSQICSKIGVNILARDHGTAVDSALATMICSGVVNPQSSGLGGGFFMLIYKRTGQQIHALDARVLAPSLENLPTSFNTGPSSIAIPGAVSGYGAAHRKFGTLQWKDLFSPAIKLATYGFPVNRQLHLAIKANHYKVQQNPHLKEKFIDLKTSEAVKIGDTVDNAPLARTLRLLAKNGPQEFYNGSISKDIIHDLASAGGPQNADDLTEYEAVWRQPVKTTLHNKLQLYSMPQPGSGQVLALIAKVIDGYSTNDTVDDLGLAYHRYVEAIKFALARRNYLGDPDFQTSNNKTVVEILAETAKNSERIREKITNITHDDPYYYGDTVGVWNHGAEAGVVIVLCPRGNAVVATSSLGSAFGSGILGKFTGIVYNNGMADFDHDSGPTTKSSTAENANYAESLKRPLSSLAPSLVKDNSGNVVLALAAGGGSSGLSAQAITLLRTLYLENDLKTAIDSPFLHNDWFPSFTKYEGSLHKSLIDELRRRGHVMSKCQSKAFVYAVKTKGEHLYSYADRRRGGCVDGY